MKKYLAIITCAVLVLLLLSCDLFKKKDEEDINAPTNEPQVQQPAHDKVHDESVIDTYTNNGTLIAVNLSNREPQAVVYIPMWKNLDTNSRKQLERMLAKKNAEMVVSNMDYDNYLHPGMYENYANSRAEAYDEPFKVTILGSNSPVDPGTYYCRELAKYSKEGGYVELE